MKITITKEEAIAIITTWAERHFADEQSGLAIMDVRSPSSYSQEYEIDIEPKTDKKEGEKR